MPLTSAKWTLGTNMKSLVSLTLVSMLAVGTLGTALAQSSYPAPIFTPPPPSNIVMTPSNQFLYNNYQNNWSRSRSGTYYDNHGTSGTFWQNGRGTYGEFYDNRGRRGWFEQDRRGKHGHWEDNRGNSGGW